MATKAGPSSPSLHAQQAFNAQQTSYFASWNLRDQRSSSESDSGKRSGSSSHVSPSTRGPLRNERRSNNRSDPYDAIAPGPVPGLLTSHSAPATALSSIDEVDRNGTDPSPATSSGSKKSRQSPAVQLLQRISDQAALSTTVARDFSTKQNRPPLRPGRSEPAPPSILPTLIFPAAEPAMKSYKTSPKHQKEKKRTGTGFLSKFRTAKSKTLPPQPQSIKALRPPPFPLRDGNRHSSGAVVTLESDFKRHTTHFDPDQSFPIQPSQIADLSSQSHRVPLPNAVLQLLPGRQGKPTSHRPSLSRNPSTSVIHGGSLESRRMSRRAAFRSSRAARIPSVAYRDAKDSIARMLERVNAELESMLVDAHARAGVYSPDLLSPGTFSCVPSAGTTGVDYFQATDTIRAHQPSDSSMPASPLRPLHPLDPAHLESHSHTLDLPETARAPYSRALSYTSSLLAHRLGPMPENTPAPYATYKVLFLSLRL
ncbi:MAG: hypothetical protein Q9227_008682 [Pyrenula ochraceoflavens]